MRSLFVCLACAATLCCAAPESMHQPLDGVWRLESGKLALDPRSLTLVQNGTTVTGSGSAMGVDAPMPLTVSGSTSGTLVDLSFTFTNGGGGSGRYAAILLSGDRLVGRVVFDNVFANQTDSVTYRRQ